jgi:Flp pilus assembly protein TadD
MDTLKYLEEAARLEKTEAWNDLLTFSQSWTEKQPNNQFAWQALGNAARNLGDINQAIAAFTRGLDTVPKEKMDFFGSPLTAGPLLYCLAHTYAQVRNFEAAKETFQRALLVDPSEVAIWNDLGVVCMETNDTMGAFEAFKKAVSLDEGNINSLTNLGILYALCERPDGVSFIAKQLAAIDPEAARIFLNRAQSAGK